MRVVRAQAMGFCFGVRDALDAARRVADPRSTVIFGELVHNEGVQADLQALGFSHTGELDRDAPPEGRDVLITAHGISDRRRAGLRDAGKHVIDTTCPLVRRAHEAAVDLAARGRLVVVVGRPGHVEVQGLVEDIPRYVVIETLDDVTTLDHDRLGVVFQTTTEEELGAAVVDALRRANPDADIEVVDTVCAPTKDRQRALRMLLAVVDAVVVVGGRNSNNTLRLVARAVAGGRPTFHVTGAHELDLDALRRYDIVGVTAGTSTPDDDVDAVCSALESPARRPHRPGTPLS